MMKFHPAITKDLKKTYGLVASAALRAMTPPAKWAVKKLFHPYNSAKRAVAGDIAAYKAKMGIAPRKGLAGRIAYWNGLVDLDMDDAAVLPALTGTVENIISKNAAFKNEGVWAAKTYAEYKAAMKARLKAQLKARQDMIDKMSDTEYKAYRHRS